MAWCRPSHMSHKRGVTQPRNGRTRLGKQKQNKDSRSEETGDSLTSPTQSTDKGIISSLEIDFEPVVQPDPATAENRTRSLLPGTHTNQTMWLSTSPVSTVAANVHEIAGMLERASAVSAAVYALPSPYPTYTRPPQTDKGSSASSST